MGGVLLSASKPTGNSWLPISVVLPFVISVHPSLSSVDLPLHVYYKRVFNDRGAFDVRAFLSGSLCLSPGYSAKWMRGHQILPTAAVSAGC